MNYYDECYHDNPSVSPEAFQELIQERTRERKQMSKEKRRDDLKRIVEMKSRDGISPVDLFPKEIWLNIMNIGTPEDRGNTWQVHPMFQNLMNSNRIRDILFPQALTSVLDHLKNSEDGYVLGHRLDISRSALSPFMKLREVSKSLRSAVDRWFEEKINEEIQQNTDRPHNWSPIPVVKLDMFCDIERLNGLIENYAGTKKTFFVRSIEVDILSSTWQHGADAEQDREHLRNDFYLPLRTGVMKLLELVGDQILFFKLLVGPVDYLTMTGVTILDHYLMLRECCQLMPNLKKLEVYFRLGGWAEVNKLPENLIETLGSHPFPKLEKLEKLSLEQNHNIYITPNIHEAILQANPQVKMLKLTMENELLGEVSLDVLNALHLKYFSLQNLSPLPSPRSIDFVFENWPLTILKIDANEEQPLREIITSLNAFPTLEKVSLFLQDVQLGRDAGFLLLSNLTHFECKFHGEIDYNRDDVNFFFTLHFLIHAKKLRRVKWIHSLVKNRDPEVNENQVLQRYLEEHEYPERMIDFRGGRRDLKTSNVWNVFPLLEILDVEIPDIVTDENLFIRTERP